MFHTKIVDLNEIYILCFVPIFLHNDPLLSKINSLWSKYKLGLYWIDTLHYVGSHSMTCPLAAHGGNSLQIWMVTVNILNKQLQTAYKGWSSSWGLDKELTTPHHKQPSCYEMSHKASEM